MRTPRSCFACLSLCTLIITGSAGSAQAYTPESAPVQAMITRGVSYIESNIGDKSGQNKELGATCICALACYKATGRSDHPVVAKAVAAVREELKNGMKHAGHANYSLGIAMIFLGELDPDQYRKEIEALLKVIYERQMSYGAWSYPNDPLGDVSQTQYAVLGMWLAHRQGINVDQDVVERVCNWLLRIQEPSGVFPYKGKDPGSYTRVEQDTQASASMCASGVASLYVCGELLGFIDDPRKMRMRTRLPPAFRAVREETEGSIAKQVDHGIWQTGVNDGNNWFSRNARVENFDEYHKGGYQQMYYMYGMERYWAFRELAEGIDAKEPAWYNAGVEYLKKKQASSGSWASTNGPLVDTGFAVMFLLRSSKKTILKLVVEAGRLRGGKGLDADMSTARMNKKGEIVTATPEKATSELLAMLSDPKAPKAEFVSDIPDRIVLDQDPKKRAAELARLRRLIINGSFQARLTAAKTLGTVRDLENGPYLIFALSDPDRRVVRAARESLRFISRKPLGFNLVIDDKPPTERIDKPVVVKAQQDWKGWLQSVKPDAEFVD